MLEVNRIYNEDCLEGLKKLDDESIDLTLTSPPYDNLRSYHTDDFEWNYDIFKPIADEIYRVTKKGGVVVWVVGDACINGGETGSSFRQVGYFQSIGFKLHDTMIYEKNSSTFPAKISSKRYSQVFEYMFVFVKGKKIRDDITLIADKRNKWAGWTNWGKHTQYDKEGNLKQTSQNKPTPEYSLRTNIWRYTVSFNDKTSHPAVFPERLAEDHILSWTVEGDLVLDPFMGSGTTAKMAMLNNRKYIGFEKNQKYYEESLERVSKHVGKRNEKIYTNDVKVFDEDKNEEVIASLQVNTKETDKEVEGKMILWENLMTELNTYFNEQKLEILKQLKLTFTSKSNDKKVQEVLVEKNLTPKEEEIPVIEKNNEIESQKSVVINMDFDIKDYVRKDELNSLIDKHLKEKLLGILSEPEPKVAKQPTVEEPVTSIKEQENTIVEQEPENNVVENTVVKTPKKKKPYTHSNGTLVKVFNDDEPYFGTIISSECTDGETIYTIEKKDTSDLVMLTAKQFRGIRKKNID